MEEYREYIKKAREENDNLWRYRKVKENQIGSQLIGNSEETKKIMILFEECRKRGFYKRVFMKVYNIKIKTASKELKRRKGITGTIYAELKEEYLNAKALILFLEKEIKESTNQISLEEIQQEIENTLKKKPEKVFRNTKKQITLSDFLSKERMRLEN